MTLKLVDLILKTITRSRRRSVLLAAGVAISIFVVSALLSVEAGFGAIVDSSDDSLLNVREKGLACPISSRVFDSYVSEVQHTQGVKDVTGVLRAIYTYQSKDNIVLVNGIDIDSFKRVKDLKVLDGTEADFAARADGALIGRSAASQFGWKRGQAVTLVEQHMSFVVTGTFTSTDKAYESTVMLHKDYLAKQKRDEGKSTFLIVRVDDASMATSVSRTIDSTFANFPKPTKTQSERAARERELQDFQELRRVLGLMVLASILVSIFGAANSVSMSVRERTREVGILRSLGLNKRHILGILIGESMFLAAAGGTVGVGLSFLLLLTDKTLGGTVPLIASPRNLLLSLFIALAIGFLGALQPAARATRLNIVTCLKVAD